MFTLLTEQEAAEMLCCSPSKIKQLRLNGHLAYLPGRPILFREEDLKTYMEHTLRQAQPMIASDKPTPEHKAQTTSTTGGTFDPVAAARQIWIKERLKSVLKNLR